MTLPKVRKLNPVKSFAVTVLAIISGSLGLPSIAAQIHPLSTSNTRPIVLVHGIPTSRNAELSQPSEWQVELDSEITNHFSYDVDSDERVRFDGETTRWALSVKRGLTNDTEIEISVPYISHEGGSLDSFIEDWHDAFGLPQNGRKNTARNQLRFFYEKNGVTKLDFQQPATGVGDAQIIFATALSRQEKFPEKHLTLKTALKFPTGDADKLTGSEGFAFSLWIAGDKAMRWLEFDGLNYFSLGAMWLEKGEVIADQQRSFALFGGVGTGIVVSQRVVLQLQLDSHTPLYESSDMIEVNSIAFLLSMGGNLKLTDNWNLDIAVVEDILPHAAPDVTFHLGINARW